MIVILAEIIGGGNSPVEAVPVASPSQPVSPLVHEVVSLNDPTAHPRQLAYDSKRDGLWFWTSAQQGGTAFQNRVFFYDIVRNQLRSWPIYSQDWSSQLLAGLAVAPNGDVWIGWNLNLIDFHPATATYSRYVLPTQPTYPLPASVLGDLPANLGIADLAVAHDGTVWVARFGALSLTSFVPSTAAFSEHPLPLDSGDPAKLSIAPNGHIFFTTDLAANKPGFGGETVGEFNPDSKATTVYAQGAGALVVSVHGDLFTALSGHGFGLAKLPASEQASSVAQHAPVFQQRVVPLDVGDSAIASDAYGRVWAAVGGQPAIAVFDPATGVVHEYRYPAPSVASVPSTIHLPGVAVGQSVPGAVAISRIVAMVTDKEGHLWFFRDGSDTLEEIAA